MSVQTTRIEAGDTLVNDDGTVTIQVNEIDGDTADVKDSRDFLGDDEYELDELQQAIEDGHFDVVRDSQLTEIKGIGDSTAPEIEAKTGCETPDELVDAYLTEQESGVNEAVRRMDYLNDWILDQLDRLDVDVSVARMKVMLFIKQLGCDPSPSSLQNAGEIVNHRWNIVDGEQLTAEHIDWNDDGAWVDSSSICGVGRGLDAMEDQLPVGDAIGEYEQCMTYERDGNHTVFAASTDEETWVSNDYMETLQDIFTFDLSDVHVHPDGEFPVYVRDEDTELVLFLAPRIR